MKLLVILLLTYRAWASEDFSKSAGFSKCESKEADVYWKTYNGEVPYDAIGVDDESFYESDTFIGAGYLENVGVLPGTLYRKNPLLKVYSDGVTYTICENIMILCSKHQENLHWVEVNLEDVPTLSNISRLVFGGFEKEIKLFIGRRYHLGTMQIGKVYIKKSKEDFNIININNDEFTEFEQFEILVYI